MAKIGQEAGLAFSTIVIRCCLSSKVKNTDRASEKVSNSSQEAEKPVLKIMFYLNAYRALSQNYLSRGNC